MDCDAVVDRMAALLDDELAPGEVELVGRHLETCAPCAALLDRMAAQEFPRPDLPDTGDPAFWAPMDEALDEAWTVVAAERAAAAAAPTPTAPAALLRRELRLPGGLALLYAALLLLAVGFAGNLYHRATAAEARVVALQERLDLQADPTAPGGAAPALLPTEPLRVEPVGLVSHAPYRGSL